MDKGFLNKVVDQILRETRIDHVKKVVQFPMYTSSFSSNIQLTSFFPPFRYHCEDIYGLNEQQIDGWIQTRHLTVHQTNHFN